MSQRNHGEEPNYEESTELSVLRRTILATGALSSGTLVPVVSARQKEGGNNGRGDSRAGERAVDREDPDPDTAIVLEELDIPIDEWVVFGNETVADHNPAYDPEEPVVVVAFEDRLESAWPKWRRGRSTGLLDGVVDRGIKFHAFPAARLGRPPSEGGGKLGGGDSVIDREDPYPDAAVVLRELDVPIEEWVVYGNETVADHNPAYDPDEPVVVVAFEDRLESAWPKWRRENPDSLFDGVVERGIKFHAFPRSRLERGRSGGS